jgi:hypothetical protein
MKKVIFSSMVVFFAVIAAAQNGFKAVVKGGHHKEPLPGATVTI